MYQLLRFLPFGWCKSRPLILAVKQLLEALKPENKDY
jgi:hypothetical protein